MQKKQQKSQKPIDQQKIINKLFNAFHSRLGDIPHFEACDFKQEIALIVFKCSRYYKEDNLSNSSFYTYAYRAFHNYLCNLKKKHLFKPISPCNASCPKYVIPAQACTSADWQQQCPKFLAHEQMQKDCLLIGRATDDYMDDASYEVEDFSDNINIDDIVAYAVKFGQDEQKFRQTILNLINSKRIDEDYRSIVRLVLAEYKKEFGI